jgi:hypothetical protein
LTKQNKTNNPQLQNFTCRTKQQQQQQQQQPKQDQLQGTKKERKK